MALEDYLKVAVVGSRELEDYSFVKETLDKILPELGSEKICLISGGARGVDKLAERYAKENGLPILIFFPDYKKYGRRAPLVRNTEIVRVADFVVAFPLPSSRGTWDTIRKAKKFGKETLIFLYKE